MYNLGEIRENRESFRNSPTTTYIFIFHYRNNSPYASQSHSRDLSPRTISPCSPGFSTSFNFPSTGPSSVKSNKSSGDPSIGKINSKKHASKRYDLFVFRNFAFSLI